MKKILSLLLVGVMIVSVVPTVFATTDYSNGTQVSYNAEADNDGDGQPDHTEAYTITVPALLTPGSSGNVVVSGSWASDRVLSVTADTTVKLINSINSADAKTLNVTFEGITRAGSNTSSISETKQVSVAAMPADALFGVWSGAFNYNVTMVDNAIKFGHKYYLTYATNEFANFEEIYGYYYEDGSSKIIADGNEFTFDAGTLVFGANNTITDVINDATYNISDDGMTVEGFQNGVHTMTWTHESVIQ